LKPFRKVAKKIMVNDSLFHCVINEIPSNEFVSLRMYSSKTSFFEVLFTWEGSWHFNYHKPKNCEKLIKYAIERGWDFPQDKQTLIIEQGDFLIEELELSV